MKKLLSALFTFTFLTIALPAKKTEAGVLVAGTGLILEEVNDCIGMCGFIGVYGGATVAILGVVAGGVTAIFNPHAGLNVALIGIALDANQKFPTKNLEQFFTHRYGFIDNQETIHELSKAIENEYHNGISEIHLSEASIGRLLVSHDLTEEQYQQVLNDLK